MSEQCATWVYAVVPAAGLPEVTAAEGIGDRPVRLVEQAGLAAVVDSVALAGPGADAEARLSGHLRDPDWLERHARIHHRVVTSFFQALPTVPFRLATLYRDDTRVRDLLAHGRDQFMEALAAVAGRAEWGVQAFRQASPPEPAAPAAGTNDRSSPGTAYLFRQRAAQAARENARQEAVDIAHQIDAALTPLSVAARSQPLPQAGADGAEPGAPLLNVSYLVARRDEERFLAATREVADRHPGVRLRVTGPWPAYSFVDAGIDSGQEEP